VGGFEVTISVVMDPTVKYHSIFVYMLTSTEKTVRDRIWRVVLVGRYPREFKFYLNSRTMAPHESDNLEKNKKGGQ
jgi:hypothetical protein